MKKLLGITVVAGVAIVGPALAQDKVEILFNRFAPPTHVLHAGVLDPLLKEVEEKTQGRVVFKLPSNSLAPPPRQLDAVNRGIVDGAYIYNPFLARRVPLITLSLLPLLGDTGESRAVALWRTYRKYFAGKANYGAAHVLGFVGAPSMGIFSLEKPIKTVDDLKGLKVWSTPATAAQALKKLDLSVVTSPVVGVYELVSKGTVDVIGALSFNDVDSFRVAQFTKSATVVPGGVAGSTFTVFVSKAKWDKISDADKKLVMEVFGENLARRSRAWDKENTVSRRAYEKAGKPIMTLGSDSMAKLREAWLPMHKAWVAAAKKQGVDGESALRYYIEQVKSVEGEAK